MGGFCCISSTVIGVSLRAAGALCTGASAFFINADGHLCFSGVLLSKAVCPHLSLRHHVALKARLHLALGHKGFQIWMSKQLCSLPGKKHTHPEKRKTVNNKITSFLSSPQSITKIQQKGEQLSRLGDGKKKTNSLSGGVLDFFSTCFAQDFSCTQQNGKQCYMNLNTCTCEEVDVQSSHTYNTLHKNP